jgi:hypothetical protein
VFCGRLIKNKTFFFFSYEGLRLRQPGILETVVPDAASRLQAPATMQPYLNAYPVPNGASLGAGLAQFNAGYSNPSSLDAASFRVDHAINSKLNLFSRYNYSPSSFTQRAPPVSTSLVLSTTEAIQSHVHTGTIGLTQLITPGISNEVRANYSNQRVATTSAMDNFGGAVPLPDSALFPPVYSSAIAAFSVNIIGVGQLNQGDFGTGEQRQFNAVDNLSVTEGGHQMKFGVDYRWLAPFSRPYNYRQFSQFSGMGATSGGALSGTAQIAAVFTQQANALLTHNLGLYIQDTWKIAPRLTLTYGLRWDVNPPLKGKNADNDPFTVSGLDYLPAIDAPAVALRPRGTRLYQTRYGNVAPRVGLAWRLGWKTRLGHNASRGVGDLLRSGSGIAGRSHQLLPIWRHQAYSGRAVSAESSECVSSGADHQSSGFHDYCSRPSFKASAHVSMECRAGAISGPEPNCIADIHRSGWARLAPGNAIY